MKKSYFIKIKFVPGILLFLLNLNNMVTAQSPKEFSEIWDKQHISNILPSNVRHTDIQNYLKTLESIGLKVDEVGRSFGNREIYQVKWGTGNFKIFMWSQMHGDEPTATSAVIDLLAFLQNNRTKLKWVEALEKSVTIHVVPMLNPDGAELYQRRNLQGIDINRDARDLTTPEGILLKKLRDEWQPDIGFNLHNQNALTAVGETRKQATISLLAVSGNPDGKTYDGHERNKRLCSLMIKALNQFISGHIGRYDDEYNFRAFGDRISEWGSPIILIETGALHNKDEMYLVRLNFIAYLTALQALVDGSEKSADPQIYEKLPFNHDGTLFNAVFRDANLISPANSAESFKTDVGIIAERRRANEIAPMFVREIGDMSIFTGLETYDVKDYFMVAKSGIVKIGTPAYFLFYRRENAANIDWKSPNLEKDFPADAIYKDGKWLKPLK